MLVSAGQQSESPIFVHISPQSHPLSHPYRSSQHTKLSSLCYTAGSHFLFILQMVMCFFLIIIFLYCSGFCHTLKWNSHGYVSPNLEFIPFPRPHPHIYSLCLFVPIIPLLFFIVFIIFSCNCLFTLLYPSWTRLSDWTQKQFPNCVKT